MRFSAIAIFRRMSAWALCILVFVSGCTKGGNAESVEPTKPRWIAPSLPASRSFLMGLTSLESDVPHVSLDATFKIVRKNADLICEHFDYGVPWQEALESKPYSEYARTTVDLRARHQGKWHHVLLLLNPISGIDITGAWTDSEQVQRQGRWASLSLDSPEVIKAYLSYCNYMIERFDPEFVVYAVDVNQHLNDKVFYPRLQKFAKEVYGALKAKHKNRAFMVSIRASSFWKNQKEQKEKLKAILPYTDFITVNVFPYFYGYQDPSTIPDDYLTGIQALAPNKPFAIACTGFNAEPLKVYGREIGGTQEGQNQYLYSILDQCNKTNAKFLVWLFVQDCDRLWDHVSFFGGSVAIYKLHKDTGLLDGVGKPRLAFDTWRKWLKLPYQPR